MHDIRTWMNVCEGKTLLEVAGTYGFFRPSDEKEILCDGPHSKEHADYILDDPAAFGLTPDEVQVALASPAVTTNATPKMQQMAQLLSLVIHKGWVRVNYYRGAWNFQALDLRTVRKAVAYYWFVHDGMQEAVIDWGPDVAHPDGVSLYPTDRIKHFLKTGRIKNTMHEGWGDGDGTSDAHRANIVNCTEDEWRLPNLHDIMPPDQLHPVVKHNFPNVTIYRAVPEGVTAIRPGDWVALSKSYAAAHERGHIISKRVPAMDVAWAGTDMNEYYYVPRGA
jgi:hypothetical protein